MPKYFVHNDEKIEDEQIIAKEFNNFFISCSSSLSDTLDRNVFQSKHTDYLKNPISNSFFFKPVTENEILEICRSLKNTTSTGYDDISCNVLKQIIHVIVVPLAHIFNASFSTGVFPQKLKIAKIIPVYKKDDKHLFQNYRPISILPSISKLIEKCAFNRLYSFLSKNLILSNSQFGFRSNHSTVHAQIVLQDKITSFIENNDFCIGVFMDLSKAFDLVNHVILLSKLQYHGVRGTAYQWFHSYLSDRLQYTQYDNSSSEFALVTHGVPQGSILGPLLFLIYINDLTLASDKFQYIMYADDTTLLYTQSDLSDIEKNVNGELELIANWFKANKLMLNLKKTNFCAFYNKKKELSIINDISLAINTVPISKVNVVNFLGVLIDCDLKWNSHINHVRNKMSKSIGILYKLKSYVPQSILISLYNTLILPYITYCIVVWGNASKSRMDVIFRLQKKAIRICTNSNYRAHSAPLFKRSRTLNVYDLFKFYTAILGFQYFQNILPTTIFSMFSTNDQIHNHNTRNSNLLHLWKVKTSFSKRLARNTVPQVWNSLPNFLRMINILSSFKRKLKHDLCSKY